MTELEKLETYLRDKQIDHVRQMIVTRHYSKTGEELKIEKDQIIVYDNTGRRVWDAICHKGSYGYDSGLLEVMGDPVVRKSDGDRVAGYLTAEDVISTLEGR